MEKDPGISIEAKVRRIKAYLDGALTSEEEVDFLRWVNASEANRVLLDRIQDEQILLNKIRFRERNNKERSWNNIQKKVRKRPGGFIRFMRYAAVLVAIVLIGVAVYRVVDCRKTGKLLVQEHSLPVRGGCKAFLDLANGERFVLDSASEMTARVEGAVIRSVEQGTVIVNERGVDSMVKVPEYNRLVVPRGGEYKIVLADGSRVWINSQSVVEFPSRFAGNERRVKLTGEAYFEVSRDVEKPFIVEIGNKEIEVLGTSFNVNDYDGRFTATLVTGRVKVRVEEENYILDPSMQICMEHGGIVLRDVDTREFTAWKDGLFVFKKQKLRDVLTTLARWYDLDVFYQNEELKDLHFTGTIERHNDVVEVVKFLEKTDMVRFTINGRTLIVSK